MKDLHISAARIRTELHWFLWSFLAALGLNIFSIIWYETRWIELVSTIHITAGIACVFYGIQSLFRMCWHHIKRFARKDR